MQHQPPKRDHYEYWDADSGRTVQRYLPRPTSPQHGMDGFTRLLIVLLGFGLVVYLFGPFFMGEMSSIGQQLGSHGTPPRGWKYYDGGDPREGHARAADDRPHRYRRMECGGSIWSDKLRCGPLQDDPTPQDQRGGGRW